MLVAGEVEGRHRLVGRRVDTMAPDAVAGRTDTAAEEGTAVVEALAIRP